MNSEEKKGIYRGAIAWMAQNPVTANLMMFLIIMLGFIGMSVSKMEVFPKFDLDIVFVNVPYPGASPKEVEQGIILAVEESVSAIDGVKSVKSTASENGGSVMVELMLGEDPEERMTEIKNTVSRITSLPENAEEPNVSLISLPQRVVTLVISGDFDVPNLSNMAERARKQILSSPDVTQAEIKGLPGKEIAIEVNRDTLKANKLTLNDVSQAIKRANIELPGGSLKTQGGELLIRVYDKKSVGSDYANIEVRSSANGAKLLLGDIATIDDGFAETEKATYYNGKPAALITAFKIGDQTPQAVAEAVYEAKKELERSFPETATLSIWNDDSILLKARIDLLVRNAGMGFALVVGILAIFLNLRLAFWVSMGIPISFMGCFLMMPGFDISINMISLFALIVTLGMVVDDAIVVGENAFEKMETGKNRLEAAIKGAKQMLAPVTFAILTSIAAFSPMFYVPGPVGKIFRIFPAVVVSILLFSLIESFFILPAHLAHIKPKKPSRIGLVVQKFQGKVNGGLKRFTENWYKPALEKCIQYRYAAIAGSFALFLGAVGLVGGGIVPFSFLPIIEGPLVSASARLPYGTPIEETMRVREVLEQSLNEAVAEYGGNEYVLGQQTVIGEQAEIPGGAPPGDDGWETGTHLITVQISLVEPHLRPMTAEQLQQTWLEKTPEIPGIKSLKFNSDIGPGATEAAVSIQLVHPDTQILETAATDLSQRLRGMSDLANIENTFESGKAQTDLSMLAGADSLGLSSAMIGQQIRHSFYGAEAIREQRGRDEMRVMVRLPKDQRVKKSDIENIEIRTPRGDFVPLQAVAKLKSSSSPVKIKRESGSRVIDVKADLAPGIRSNTESVAFITRSVLPELKNQYPGLKAGFVGEQQRQADSMSALGRGYLVAIFAIYALLAIPFKSYLQPIVIMSAIPMGFVGAVIGHVIMGFELSLISMFGIIALSGVVVNDSLVLMAATNDYRKDGESAIGAVVRGGCRRLRPILLTSLTTFFGLVPMLFETDVQARFLIPMAISLGFGVLFATVVILILVPSIYIVLEDFIQTTKKAMKWIFGDNDLQEPQSAK